MAPFTADAIEQALIRRGRRITAARHQLLEAMAGAGDTFAAETVADAAPGVGRATVFRTLRMLQELGFVCQVVLGDGTVAYRLGSEGHHHHTLCHVCGSVADFSSPAIEEALREIERTTGFATESHRIELYGRCASCDAEQGTR